MPSADVPDAAHPAVASQVASLEIRGQASPEQVAALVAVLSSVGGGQAPVESPRSASWADHGRAVGVTPTHGRGAWRASGQPR